MSGAWRVPSAEFRLPAQLINWRRFCPSCGCVTKHRCLRLLLVWTVLLLLSLVLGVVFAIAYGLQLLMNLPIALMLTFVITVYALWLLIRWIVRMIVFPGSLNGCVAIKEAEWQWRYCMELEWALLDLKKLIALLKPSEQAEQLRGRADRAETNEGDILMDHQLVHVPAKQKDEQQCSGYVLPSNVAVVPRDVVHGPDRPCSAQLKDVLDQLECENFAGIASPAVGSRARVKKKTPDLAPLMKRSYAAVQQLRRVQRNFTTQVEDAESLNTNQRRFHQLVMETTGLLERLMVVTGGIGAPLLAVMAQPAALEGICFATPVHAQEAERLLSSGKDIGLIDEMLQLIEEVSQAKTSFCSCPCRRKRNPQPIVGTLAFMRAELQCHHDGIPFRLPAQGGFCDRLDAMLIPRPALAREGRAQLVPGCIWPRPAPTKDIDFSDEVVMVMMGPNASYFEAQAVSSDTLLKYMNLGFSVLLFNYRGYGRSTGFPSTWRCTKDGEAAIRYVKKHFGVKKFAVYGRSMGGFVACHLARKISEVELLIADRTFASLQATAVSQTGLWAAVALQFVWCTARSTRNFTSASNCYKVTVNDPLDQIICDAVSLRTGVAQRISSMSHSTRTHSRQVFADFLSAWSQLLAEGTNSSSSASGGSGSAGCGRESDSTAFNGGGELSASAIAAVSISGGERTPMHHGDKVRWLRSDDTTPDGTLGTVGANPSRGDVDCLVLLPRGEVRLFKMEELRVVTGIELLGLQCLAIVGDLDAGGLMLKSALSRHLLANRNLKAEAMLRVWRDNLQVWGSRQARSTRAILAWKARCTAIALAAKQPGAEQLREEATDSIFDAAMKHWNHEHYYCAECGIALRTPLELLHHRDKECGGTLGVFAVGDRVECRGFKQRPHREYRDWQPGVVTCVEPLQAKLDSGIESNNWRDMRPLVSGSADAEDFHIYSLEQAAFDMHRAACQLKVKVEEVDTLSGEECPNTRAQAAALKARLRSFQAFISEMLRYFHVTSIAEVLRATSNTGYLVHCSCGHNGNLPPFAMEQLAMHVKRSHVVPVANCVDNGPTERQEANAVAAQQSTTSTAQSEQRAQSQEPPPHQSPPQPPPRHSLPVAPPQPVAGTAVGA